MATNLALDRLRSRSRRKRYEPVHEADALTDNIEPERQVSAGQALEVVRRALQELPERYRQVFYLDRLGDKTAVEIGRDLGIGERQVRTYLRRTLVYCQLRLDGITAADAKERITTL